MTKWNFLPFRPGLVGGHCIGVDPYYLIQKAQSTGYYPDILLACRRINDAMGQHVAAEVIKLMVQRGSTIAGARILLLERGETDRLTQALQTLAAGLLERDRRFEKAKAAAALRLGDPQPGHAELDQPDD